MKPILILETYDTGRHCLQNVTSVYIYSSRFVFFILCELTFLTNISDPNETPISSASHPNTIRLKNDTKHSYALLFMCMMHKFESENPHNYPPINVLVNSADFCLRLDNYF